MLLYDPTDRGTPDSIHLAVTGPPAQEAPRVLERTTTSVVRPDRSSPGLARLRTDPLSSGVPERRSCDGRGDVLTEHLDIEGGADLVQPVGKVGERDRTSHGVPDPPGRHPRRHGPVVEDGLVAQDHRGRVVEDETGERAGESGRPLRGDRLRAEERSSLGAHREVQARLERRLLRGHVRTPRAVPLLEAQRVERPVAGEHHTVFLAGREQRVEEPSAELHRRVELPAELTHVRHPGREARHVAHHDPLRGHVREGRAREVGRREGARISRASGPQIPRHAIDPVMSRTRTSISPPRWSCLRIHPMSWLPKAVPVTRRNRWGSSLVTVRSHSMPPRWLSIWEYVTVPGGRSIRFAQIRSRNAGAPGPETSIFEKLDSSNSPARSRVAMCSTGIAVDQCSPAHPRGRRSSWEPSSFETNQFARSHPDFSPKTAPCSASRG